MRRSYYPAIHRLLRLDKIIHPPQTYDHYKAIISRNKLSHSSSFKRSLSTQLHLKEIHNHDDTNNFHELTTITETKKETTLSQQTYLLDPKIDKTNEILNTVPIGKMSLHNVSKARYLIGYWAKLRTADGVQKAEDLLERVITEKRDGRNDGVHVDARLYNSIIDSWGKSGSYDGPLRAESLLNEMERRYVSDLKEEEEEDRSHMDDLKLTEDGDTLHPQPNIDTFNSLMHAWSQSNRPESISKVEEIVSRLEGNNPPLANTNTYNILMNAYANQIGEYGFAQKAEDILLRMSQLSKDENSNINPDTLSFNTVLKAWKNSGGGIESARRAQDILRLMVKLHSEGHDNVKPDSISWCTVMYAYGKHFKAETNIAEKAISEAEDLIDFLMESSNHLQNFDSVASSVIKSMLDCLLKTGAQNAGDIAKQVLDKILEKKNFEEIFNDSDTTTFLIQIYSESKDRDIALKSNEILKDILDGVVVGVEPTTSMINKVLHTLCRIGEEEEAENLYRRMLDISGKNGLDDLLPDIATINIMANMYFRSQHRDSCRKLDDIVQQLEDTEKAGNLDSFDTFAHSVLINKLSQSTRIDAGKKAYELLEKIEYHFLNNHENCIRPDTIMYNMVLSTIAKGSSKNAADKVAQIIQKMENEGKESVIPDTMTYSIGVNAWVRSGSNETSKKVVELLGKIERLQTVESSVKLDTVLFKTVLRGFQQGRKDDGDMAEKILERMIKYRQDGNLSILPSATCCNLVLKAHCATSRRSSNMKPMFHAHNLLLQFVEKYQRDETEFFPDKIGFNTVMTAWAKSKHSKAYEKTKELYCIMEDLSKKGTKDMKPDSFTNSAMLRSISTSRRPKSARRAQNFFDTLNPDDLDVYNYNCLLLAWARSNERNKVKIAHQILEVMEETKKIDLMSYNIFLNACASSRSDNKTNEKKLALVQETYKALNQSFVPDEFTFRALLNVSKKLRGNNNEYNESFKEFFEDCCREGNGVGRKIKNEWKTFYQQ